MLYLLRKIRRKLISTDNKVVTYLLYAIGEIILVVVGILIAVQIDDWNKHRQKRQQEIESLQQIRASMYTAVDQLDKSIDAFIKTSNRLKSAITLIEGRKILKEKDSLAYKINSSLGFPTPKFDKSAYDNLKMQGADLITNDSLRQEILSIYEIEFYYMTHELDQGLRDYRNIMIPYTLKYVKLDVTDLTEKGPQFLITDGDLLINDKNFLNMLHHSFARNLIGKRHSTQLKVQIEQLIIKIENELNRLKSS
ncbi:MAG: DUF6090 family protein [Cyclobacteriaceae bacterium]